VMRVMHGTMLTHGAPATGNVQKESHGARAAYCNSNCHSWPTTNTSASYVPAKCPLLMPDCYSRTALQLVNRAETAPVSCCQQLMPRLTYSK
jgi:hypothetical protein